jgi:hypothetical protein
VPRAALRHSQGEQRPGALERHRHALVLGEGASERLERGLEVARRGVEKPSRARRNGQRPGLGERTRLVFQPVDEGAGGLELADRDRRLDRVREQRGEVGVSVPLLVKPIHERQQPVERRPRIAEREVNEREP